MLNKLPAILLLLGIIVFAVYEYMVDLKMSTDFKRVVTGGPWLSAKDGEELCKRIRELETVSYGFKDSHKPILNCDYNSWRSLDGE